MALIQWLPFLAIYQIYWRSLWKIEAPSFPVPPAGHSLVPGQGEASLFFKKCRSSDGVVVVAAFLSLCSSQGLEALAVSWLVSVESTWVELNNLKPISRTGSVSKSPPSQFIHSVFPPREPSFPWRSSVTWRHILCFAIQLPIFMNFLRHLGELQGLLECPSWKYLWISSLLSPFIIRLLVPAFFFNAVRLCMSVGLCSWHSSVQTQVVFELAFLRTGNSRVPCFNDINQIAFVRNLARRKYRSVLGITT